MQQTERKLATGGIDAMLDAYARDQEPAVIDFRAVAPFRAGQDRGTHLIHAYPAKLLLNIPYFFLQSSRLAPAGATLLDPFCGSGTVPLEGIIAGLNVVAADANPLARIITQAKTTVLSPSDLTERLGEIVHLSRQAQGRVPDVVNVEYWYSARVIAELAALGNAIEAAVRPKERAFFSACFSSCARRVSLADPRLSVPVKINPNRAENYGAKGDLVLRRWKALETIDVAKTFWRIAAQNIVRMGKLKLLSPSPDPSVQLNNDARQLDLADGSVDLIITSPPYVGAQKYVRASSLSLGWLGLTPNCQLRDLERQSIGREHLSRGEGIDSDTMFADSVAPVLAAIKERNPLRARIATTYLAEMRASLQEMHRVMRPGGHLVLVVGPNVVAGIPFFTPQYLAEIAQTVGFEIRAHLVDDIRSRGLMSKRNKTASMITQEVVFVFEKR